MSPLARKAFCSQGKLVLHLQYGVCAITTQQLNQGCTYRIWRRIREDGPWPCHGLNFQWPWLPSVLIGPQGLPWAGPQPVPVTRLGSGEAGVDLRPQPDYCRAQCPVATAPTRKHEQTYRYMAFKSTEKTHHRETDSTIGRIEQEE